MKPGSSLLKGLSIFTSIVGAIAILFALAEGFTAEGGIGVIFLSGGVGLLLASVFIWAAGKALEILARIETNTRKDKP